MDKSEILGLYDQYERIQVLYTDSRREATPQVVRHIGQYSPDSWITYAWVTDESLDAVMDEQIAYFERIGHNFEWKTYDHDQPANLRQRLAARGFEVGEREALLAIEIAAAPAALLQPVTLDVRRITDVNRLADVIQIENAVWGEDESLSVVRLRRDLQDNPNLLSVYVAYVDEVPASCAWLYYSPGSPFAGLWGGSTRAEYRARGLYTALLAARVQEAQARGVRFLNVDASPMSQPILEKHGFQRLTYTYPCHWDVPHR